MSRHNAHVKMLLISCLITLTLVLYIMIKTDYPKGLTLVLYCLSAFVIGTSKLFQLERFHFLFYLGPEVSKSVTTTRPTTRQKLITTTSLRPIATTTQKPITTTSLRPIATTSQKPITTTSLGPIATTARKPIKITSLRPIAMTTRKPITTTQKPVTTTTWKPVTATSRKPVIKTTSQKFLKTITGKLLALS